MADLWEEINQLLFENHKELKISDIENDINWLYERKQLKKPEILLFKSASEFNKYIKQFNYDELPKYGLANEIEFYAYWTNNAGTLDLKRYCAFLKKGIFHAIFDDHKALICMLPEKILLDNNNDFHSLKGYALSWYDETGKYFIYGRRFSKRLFDLVSTRKMKMIKVLSIKNIEQRYVALRLYGIDRMLTELKDRLTLVHESEKGNKLYNIEIDDNLTAQFLLYSCPSTGRQYTKYVDDQQNYRNADLAMAESHNMTLEQYQSMEIES